VKLVGWAILGKNLLDKAGEETADAEPEEAGEGEGLKVAKSITCEVLAGNL
jgi:hypothetical protein